MRNKVFVFILLLVLCVTGSTETQANDKSGKLLENYDLSEGKNLNVVLVF